MERTDEIEGLSLEGHVDQDAGQKKLEVVIRTKDFRLFNKQDAHYVFDEMRDTVIEIINKWKKENP